MNNQNGGKAIPLPFPDNESHGDARFYRLDPPLTTLSWMREEKFVLTHVIVMDVDYDGVLETLILPANELGEIMDTVEILGSRQCKATHAEVLGDMLRLNEYLTEEDKDKAYLMNAPYEICEEG